MNHTDFMNMIEMMEQYGGAFVKSFARTLRSSDPINRTKLMKALPDIVKHYSALAQLNKEETPPQ